MEPEFWTPIQISSWGGAEAEGFGWVFMTPQGLTGRSLNRAPREHPLDDSNENSPGELILEEKPSATTRTRTRNHFSAHEKLYENHPEFILTELDGKWKIGE
jgi:hypothetical protein